jgi:hypothetical protein
MLEPQRSSNRVEFNRLKRIQLLIVLTSPVGALALMILLDWLGLFGWLAWILMPSLLATFGLIALLEFRKVLLFRKDLVERRGADVDAEDPGVV